MALSKDDIDKLLGDLNSYSYQINMPMYQFKNIYPGLEAPYFIVVTRKYTFPIILN